MAGIVDGAQKGEIDFIYLLGADEFDVAHLGRAFVVYQGSHGDAGAHHADVILPGAAYTEKDGLYVNFEGRVQRAERAAFPPGEAKEDWAILRALSEVLGTSCPMTIAPRLRARDRQATRRISPKPAMRRSHADADCRDLGRHRRRQAVGRDAPLAAAITDYYLTNPIARASETMAKCSQEFVTGPSKMAAE